MHGQWPWPQTSGAVCARGPPGWEAPTPGRVSPGAPTSHGFHLGLYEGRFPEPGVDSLETPKAGPQVSGRCSPVQFLGITPPKPNGQPPAPVPGRVWGAVIQGLGNAGDGRPGKSKGAGEIATCSPPHPRAAGQRRRVPPSQIRSYTARIAQACGHPAGAEETAPPQTPSLEGLRWGSAPPPLSSLPLGTPCG